MTSIINKRKSPANANTPLPKSKKQVKRSRRNSISKPVRSTSKAAPSTSKAAASTTGVVDDYIARSAMEGLISRVPEFNNIANSEMRLTSYIDNFMFNLLGDINHNDLHSSNQVITEKKENAPITRPDFKGNVLDNNGKTVYTNIYGEIKPLHATNNQKNLLAIDLYRILTFSKQQAQNNNLNYVLSYQAVGCFITFYILVKRDQDGLYSAIELDTIYIATHIKDLQFMIFMLPFMRKIVKIYCEYCFRTSSFNITTSVVSPTPQYDLIINSLSESQNKKRRCAVEYDQHTNIVNIIALYTAIEDSLDPSV